MRTKVVTITPRFVVVNLCGSLSLRLHQRGAPQGSWQFGLQPLSLEPFHPIDVNGDGQLDGKDFLVRLGLFPGASASASPLNPTPAALGYTPPATLGVGSHSSSSSSSSSTSNGSSSTSIDDSNSISGSSGRPLSYLLSSFFRLDVVQRQVIKLRPLQAVHNFQSPERLAVTHSNSLTPPCVLPGAYQRHPQHHQKEGEECEPVLAMLNVDLFDNVVRVVVGDCPIGRTWDYKVRTITSDPIVPSSVWDPFQAEPG